ncbi:ImmA/IrrE family metallo-endopeptidase [Ensifer aridi]|uniref:ImmA/IrrE family metallo-endopeptidase n=1 Tax=Ensifer aridi TaxID=1708715 RepID=UPI001FCD81A8|nr:ImmA/IrrE family metallo-endopeptidase [Ensifer aridi]
MSAIEPSIGKYEIVDINDHITRLLRDLDNPEPPLKLEDVRELQKLDLTYYSKSDLNLLDEIAHRAKMAGSTLISTASRMIDVVDRFNLRGLLMLKENEKKIFIDDQVAQLKRRFIISHEIIHDLLPWHRSLLLGDNESTLSPTCHQTMEAEANYGGRRLIFLGERFKKEARDVPFSWAHIQSLNKRYGNTLTTTLWQMVCERSPEHPVFAIISRHPYHPDIGDFEPGENVSHMIRSNGFQTRFANITPPQAYQALQSYISARKKGPVGEGVFTFQDINGERCDFEMSSFCNGYTILTYGVFRSVHKLIF